MAVIQLQQREDPSQMLQSFLLQMQNRNEQRRQQEAALKQNQSQFDQSLALDRERTTAQTGLMNTQANDVTARRGAEQSQAKAKLFIEKVWDPSEKNGRIDVGQALAQAFIKANPDSEPYLAALLSQRPQMDTDRAAGNVAKFSADQTAIAAGGSPDVQARAFTQEAALQRPMSAQQFADQAQRQPEAADTKTPYGQTLNIAGGRMPDAGQKLQSNTQLTMNREDNASQERIAGMRADTVQARPSSAIEKRTLGFYLRAKDAVDQLEGAYENGKPLHEEVGNKGLVGQLWQKHAPNMLQPEENQLYEQAQRQFTEARLRKDSGAAIPEQEFENDRRTYFAQPGDGPEVIKRKKAARQQLLDSLKMESGRAYGEHYGDEGQMDSSTEGGQAPIVQRNKRTGEMRYSTDGGATWRQGQP